VNRTVAIAALVLACTAPASGRGARMRVENGAQLVDVRTAAEYAVQHIEGARNIPLDELPNRTSELGDHDSPVVVYCMSGHRSAQAVRVLQDAGFTHVYDVGAMTNY
jgi:phage shock protein E